MDTRLPEQVEALCAALYDKKAQDIVAIHVGDRTIIADWFVICSGRATPQVKALCDELEEKAAQAGLTLRRREGYDAGRWIVLDYADILVHIFHPEERRYYNIERLWDMDGGAVMYSALRDAGENAPLIFNYLADNMRQDTGEPAQRD